MLCPLTNEAGLFEGSFFLEEGCQFDPLLHISRRTNPMSISLYTIVKHVI